MAIVPLVRDVDSLTLSMDRRVSVIAVCVVLYFHDDGGLISLNDNPNDVVWIVSTVVCGWSDSAVFVCSDLVAMFEWLCNVVFGL